VSLGEEPDTEQLRAVQAERAVTESHRAVEADEAGDAEEQRAHARRADKAAYLRDRLAEQAESQRE
jgi:hypothetical protein